MNKMKYSICLCILFALLLPVSVFAQTLIIQELFFPGGTDSTTDVLIFADAVDTVDIITIEISVDTTFTSGPIDTVVIDSVDFNAGPGGGDVITGILNVDFSALDTTVYFVRVTLSPFAEIVSSGLFVEPGRGPEQGVEVFYFDLEPHLGLIEVFVEGRNLAKEDVIQITVSQDSAFDVGSVIYEVTGLEFFPGEGFDGSDEIDGTIETLYVDLPSGDYYLKVSTIPSGDIIHGPVFFSPEIPPPLLGVEIFKVQFIHFASDTAGIVIEGENFSALDFIFGVTVQVSDNQSFTGTVHTLELEEIDDEEESYDLIIGIVPLSVTNFPAGDYYVKITAPGEPDIVSGPISAPAGFIPTQPVMYSVGSLFFGDSIGKTVFEIPGDLFDQVTITNVDVSLDSAFTPGSVIYTVEIIVFPNEFWTIDIIEGIIYEDISSIPTGDYYVRLNTSIGPIVSEAFTFLGVFDVFVSLPDTFGTFVDTVLVPVYINDDVTGKEIYAAQFTVDYDPSVVQFIDIDYTGIFINDFALEYNVGEGQIQVSLAVSFPFEGSGKLINLRMRPMLGARAGNVSNLNFVDFLFNEGDPPAIFENGSYRIDAYFGDVNSNNTVNASDAVEVLRNVVGKTPLMSFSFPKADVTGVGGVTAFDASYILQYSVGLIDDYPVESIIFSGGVPKPAADQKPVAVISSYLENDNTIVYSIKNGNTFGVYSLHAVMELHGLDYMDYELSPEGKEQESIASAHAVRGQLNVATVGAYPVRHGGDIIQLRFRKTGDDGALSFTKIVLNEANVTEITVNSGEAPLLPTEYELYQNYPNPFNPATTIKFDIPKQVRVGIRIYNTLGQVVKNLFDDVLEAGFHEITWDGRNNSGNQAPSGMYIYRVVAGGFVEAKKMVLIR